MHYTPGKEGVTMYRLPEPHTTGLSQQTRDGLCAAAFTGGFLSGFAYGLAGVLTWLGVCVILSIANRRENNGNTLRN